MRSIRLQLLVTFLALAATGASLAWVQVSFGPWPTRPLFSALRRYDREQIMRNLRWGGDPNGPPGSGTLLHYAIRKHDMEVIEMAIARGADVNRMSGDGTTSHGRWTPLSYAEFLGHGDIAEILRRHGARSECWSTGIP